jgi:hypothetical protein
VASTTVIAAALLLITGCVAGATAPEPTRTASTSTPTPHPTPTVDPELVVGGTAGQNRPFFEFVIGGLLESTPAPSSLGVIDALVAAGFDRAAMQVTADTTRVGNPADSILFSVLIDGQCLLGQVAQGAFESQLADVLGSGRCLVGRTLSLD